MPLARPGESGGSGTAEPMEAMCVCALVLPFFLKNLYIYIYSKKTTNTSNLLTHLLRLQKNYFSPKKNRVLLLLL